MSRDDPHLTGTPEWYGTPQPSTPSPPDHHWDCRIPQGRTCLRYGEGGNCVCWCHDPVRADSPSPEGAEPRTKRGRVLLDDLRAFIPAGLWTPFREEQIAVSITAIEREAALPEPSLDVERLQRISALQPEAVEMLRRHGFVMDKVGPLDDNATELDRWKVLAFSLYTDIVEASVTADHILEARLGTGETE